MALPGEVFPQRCTDHEEDGVEALSKLGIKLP